MLMGRSEYQTPNIRSLVVRLCDELGLNFVYYDDYPMMKVMPGADAVAGYAGWTSREAEALGIPLITVAAINSTHQPERATCRTGQDVRERLEAVTVLDHITSYTDQSAKAAVAIAELVEGSP